MRGHDSWRIPTTPVRVCGPDGLAMTRSLTIQRNSTSSSPMPTICFSIRLRKPSSLQYRRGSPCYRGSTVAKSYCGGKTHWRQVYEWSVLAVRSECSQPHRAKFPPRGGHKVSLSWAIRGWRFAGRFPAYRRFSCTQ